MNTQVALFEKVSTPVNLTSSVLSHQTNLIQELRSGLDKDIVGQDRAKDIIIKTLLNGIFNIYREQWALGAIFLGGPTGVGKTEMVRSLARMLFGDPNAFTKISAETMPHPADIAKLTGSPAGYIGYGDTPLLSDKRVHSGYKIAKEKWKLHPLIQGYDMENVSLVLVDETEKAHPDIPNAFLNAIQSGEMEMSSGKEGSNTANSQGINHSRFTDLRNTFFVFTSNVGEHSIKKWKGASMWFTHQTEDTNGDHTLFEQELKRHFAPEFLGRMDAVVRCESLTEEHMRSILALNVDKMNQHLTRGGYFSSLRVTTSRQFVDHVLAESKGTEYGARAISGIIKNIGSQVGFVVRSGRLTKDASGTIEFDMENGNPVIQFLDQPALSERSTEETVTMNRSDIQEQVRVLVEGNINTHGDRVRNTVQEYLSLLEWYDTWLGSICARLERRLQGYGFDSMDIDSLQGAAFQNIYKSVDQPWYGEDIIRDRGMFHPLWFRPIERFLQSVIIKNYPLDKIQNSIRTFLDRPMTKDESIVISQHIHRLLQQKKFS